MNRIFQASSATSYIFKCGGVAAALILLLTACGSDTDLLSSAVVESGPIATNFDSDEIALAKTASTLYLIIGQSNSAGRDTNFDHAGEDAPDSDVLLFTDANTFETAVQPLNKYSGVRKTTIAQGVNFGLAFGKSMHSATGEKVHLVVNARGGTKVAVWRKDKSSGYFENTVQRVRDAEAACNCQLTGILWHQGEGNVSGDGTYTSSYFASLVGLIREYRDELGEVPFLAGQLYRNSGNWRFNKDLQQIDDADFAEPEVDWVTSLNMTTIDGTHFDAPSMRKFGGRYATLMQRLID